MGMYCERYRPSEKIASDGDIAYSFYIVKSGKVAMEKNGKVLDFMSMGDYFGEDSLSYDTVKRHVNYRAENDVEVLSIGKWPFLRIFGNEFNTLVIKNIIRI